MNYLRQRAKADQQIRKWGARALLRRSAGDRECWALEVQLSTSERRNLKSPTSRVFLISAIGVDVPPVMREDSLITFVQPEGVVENPPLRQVAPVAPLAPGGVVIYWELQVE